MGIITLTTDFGLKDEYVGVLKGVVLSLHRSATIIDITHHIPAHDMVPAAFLLEAVYPFFSPGTVHVVVVDPGVGGARDILAVKVGGQFMLAPDNGVLTRLVLNQVVDQVVRVIQSKYFLPRVSATFHGRDIFAPVAAHLAQGLEMDCLGPEVAPEKMVMLPNLFPQMADDGGSLVGKVVSVDHFGNLITNIKLEDIQRLNQANDIRKLVVYLGEFRIGHFVDCYAMAGKGNLLATISSRGYVEIAVNCGRAADLLNAAAGAPIHVGRETE